jgi:lycopene cyclase domain-containing protein
MNVSTSEAHLSFPFFNQKTGLKWGLPLLGLVLISLLWFMATIKKDNLLFDVSEITQVRFFETHYLYLYAHIFALFPILCLSFDKKVAFYKTWKYLIPALFIVAVPYWIWDIVKTDAQVWGFNPQYYTFKILNLPIEEWLFFITFPFASIFIYECLNAYFPNSKIFNMLKRIDTPLSIGLIFFFFGLSFLYFNHKYTMTTFLIGGFILLWQFLFGSQETRLLFYRMFPIATIPFILVNGVFTGGFTEQPIVVYNPEEYLGIRFFTIPVDDFNYNFGLELAVIMVYEKLKNNRF